MTTTLQPEPMTMPRAAAVPLVTFAEGARSADVVVDVARLIESKLLVQANSGGGKSRAIRYLLEQTHGRVQHVVLDREGEFSTLRTRYSYLLAGPGGEVAADVRTAPLLARRVMELGVSVVVDLSEMDVGRQREYVAAYIGAMNHLPRELWKDCLVIVDEAHLFAPEAGKGQSPAREALAMAGATWRKRGYGLVLATQRIAKLDKDVAAECLNKLIGRTSDTDKKRAGEELDLDRAGVQSLRALSPGTFWAYGPAIAVDPVLVCTGDVTTAPPTRGARRAPAPPTPDAIRALAGEFADLPQQADDEAHAVERLQREVRELRGALRRAEKAAPPAATVDLAAMDRAVAKAVREATLRHEHLTRELVARLAPAAADLRATADALDGLRERVASAAEASAPVVPAAPFARRVQAAPRAVATATGLSRTQQLMLNALAFFASLGQDATERAAIAGLVGVTHTGGSFSNNLSALRQGGYIEDRAGGTVTITPAGEAAVTDRPAVDSLADLHALWLSHRSLSGTQQRMLAELVAAHPHALTRADLADRIGVAASGGSYSNNLSKLRTMGLMDDVSRTEVRASALLFPEGLV